MPAHRNCAGSNSSIGMMRTRGSRSLNACTSYSRSKNSSPRRPGRRSPGCGTRRTPRRPTRRPSRRSPTSSTKSPSLLTRTTSASRCRELDERPLDRDVDDLLAGAAGEGTRAGSRWPATPGRTASAGRCWPRGRRGRVAGWSHRSWAKCSSRSHRGRSSGRGRRPRMEVPRVASMFSPSTRTYVVRGCLFHGPRVRVAPRRGESGARPRVAASSGSTSTRTPPRPTGPPPVGRGAASGGLVRTEPGNVRSVDGQQRTSTRTLDACRASRSRRARRCASA